MHPSVLVVTPDVDRVAAVRTSLAAGGLVNPVVACRDGVDAAAYVLGRSPFTDRGLHPLPAVVVTDLHLPRGSGLKVLRLVRSHLGSRRTPVIVVGHEAADAEILEAHRLGAAAYLSRDIADVALLDVIRDLGTPWSIGRMERRMGTPA